MFTNEELKAIAAFLERVNLNGKEAQTLVYLQNKIKDLTKDHGTDKAEKTEKPKK